MIVVGNHVPAIPSSDLFDDIMRRHNYTDDAYCPVDTEAEPIKKANLDDYNSVAMLQLDWEYNRGNRIKRLDISKLINVLGGITGDDGDISMDMCFFSKNKRLMEALLKCFTGVCKSYRHVEKDGFRKDLKDYRAQKNVVLQGDDGDEYIQPAEMENVDNTVIVDYEKIAIAQKLGYYLKMFHEGSKRHGISLMSFIIAYLKFNNGVASTLRKDNRKYVASSIQKVDSFGNCIGVYNENHNTSKTWKEQAPWFYNRNEPEYQDIYNIHVDEFIELCLRAGIDLSKEDPTDFTADVIEKITTTYIMSNIEFVASYMGKMDSAVFRCLSPENLLRPGSAVLTPAGEAEGCYFMEAFIDDVTEVLSANYSSDKTFIKKQAYYTREIDKDKLYVSGIPYFYLWYYMAEVYMRMFHAKIESPDYNISSLDKLKSDIKEIRLTAFRVTVNKIFKNNEATKIDNLVSSNFYISYSEEYHSWRTNDRKSDLALNDYIICTRSWITDLFRLSYEQSSRIPEKFVVTSYGCVVGQRYTNSTTLRGFDVYDLQKVTDFMNCLLMSDTAQERARFSWPEPEVF